MPGHSLWDELAVGLALGALEPEDEQTFLGHLRGCVQCAKTVADMEAVSGQLAYAVPADEPPPALLASIMREVAASDRPATPLGRATPDVSRLPGPRRAGGPSTARRWDSSWLARAAVLLVVLALTGWNYQLRLDGKVKSRSLQNAADAARLLATPGTSRYTLTSNGAERATVLVNADKAYLVVDNFKRNDAENSIYVLWAQKPEVGLVGVEKFKIAHDGPTYVPVRKGLTASSTIQAYAISKETGSQIPATPSAPIAKVATFAAS